MVTDKKVIVPNILIYCCELCWLNCVLKTKGKANDVKNLCEEAVKKNIPVTARA